MKFVEFLNRLMEDMTILEMVVVVAGSHHGQDGGRAHGRGRGHRVHFDDDEFDNFDHEEGSDENPFANDGLHRRHHDHRRHADHGDKEHHHGRHNREDLDSIARVKLSIPKFTGREDADAYLEWAE